MKIPKPKISTKYWKGKTTQQWKEETNRMLWYIGIFAIINIIYNIFNNANWYIITVNAIPYITATLGIISYNKHKKEEQQNANKTSR